MADPRPEPPRSPLSLGFSWASRATALGLEFVLPTLGGYYLDRRWGSQPTLTLLGTVLGFVVGMAHLLRIAREGSGRSPQ